MAEIKKINVGGVDYDVVGKELTKVTYAELKALRDNGELLGGHLYRITDYVTTTVQQNTKSAGNVFDVIVLATSTNKLSHIARAIQHEGDIYFDGNDLGAWELWYDLDNDINKYAWADATRGKGVIYRMIDEKRNDCPYDFKNILFYNNEIALPTTGDKYYYTFSYVVSGNLFDGTVAKQVTTCHSNTMRMYVSSKKKSLNQNVFRNKGLDQSCYNNTFGFNCYNNIFGASCHTNSFKGNCNHNTFEDECIGNTFGTNCYGNKFGARCKYNTFGTSCFGNTFGGNSSSNTFGDSCGSNTFGFNCYYNTFGFSCYDNTFGDNSKRRHLDYEKKTITLNDEYYDDGSGQLVPIKHPDLSTQPSILPYKFMGQYVYEQLIPVSKSIDVLNAEHFTISTDEFAGVNIFSQPNVGVLEANLVLFTRHESIGGYSAPAAILYCPVSVITNEQYGSVYQIEVRKSHSVGAERTLVVKAWLRFVYSSMPEEDGYYGYNNY